ncbi:hypothetical protein E1281_22115 [Actinomadura sp. KC345]|uniref:hypothetical protein n=1 Tax=Actinomadura sp. KC345 TaxID=2530371 RepID=UPI0010DFCD75|nr:hypothetical protein [Actinomadura sp. KC345]TDC50344.1 hypothetical protein E1281_22115 [Actinomadura sp. KC345]
MPLTPPAQPYGSAQPPMSEQASAGQPYASEQPPAFSQSYMSDQASTSGQPYIPEQTPVPGQAHLSEQPPASARPPLQLSVEPSEPGPSSTTQGSSPAFDPESTAAWTFNPDEDDDEPQAPASGGFGAVPALPGGAAEPRPTVFEMEPPSERREPIVPESWFAQPRKPGGQDTDATQIAPVQGMQNPGMPAPMGFGGDFDQTRMDPGGPMGAPPMAQGPMGPGVPMEQNAPMEQGAPMGGPGGPGYGAYPPPQGGKPGGGTSKPLLAAVAALVTIAVGSVVFVVWPSGDSSSASTGTSSSPSPANTQVAQKNQIPAETKQQAAVMNKVLDDSAATRSVLAGAIGRAGKCKTLPQAIQGFQKVAQRRQNQLGRTRNLQVDKLANGERLRGSLAQALTASLQVDQVLLKWAQKNQRNCRGKPRPAAAQVPGRAAIERRATTAKQKFVVLWNPVAKKTGQPQRSWKRV